MAERQRRGTRLQKLRKPEHGVERCAQLVAHVGEELGFGLIGFFRDGDGLLQIRFEFFAFRYIAEIADDTVAAVGQRNAIELPLIALHHAEVRAPLDPLGHHVRLSGFEGVAESLGDFIGVRGGPENVNHFVKVPADKAGNIAEEGNRNGIRLTNAKVPIDQIDADGCCVKQPLELGGAQAQGILRTLVPGNFRAQLVIQRFRCLRQVILAQRPQ